jgi:curved DNA-binding protein CbpA
MSSSLAGKFQDHYDLLGIDPKSDSETVQRAYALLAEKYQDDPEKFEALNMAYEVLADPLLRREFDKLKGIGAEDGAPKFSGSQFFEALGRDDGLRSTVLCILYDRRRTSPFKPSVSMRHLEGMLEATTEELNFTLWYLKQRSLVLPDDKSSLQITVEGMDLLEKNRPSPDVVMTFIKAASVVAGKTLEAPAAPAAPEEQSDSQRLGSRVVGLLKNAMPRGEGNRKAVR